MENKKNKNAAAFGCFRKHIGDKIGDMNYKNKQFLLQWQTLMPVLLKHLAQALGNHSKKGP